MSVFVSVQLDKQVDGALATFEAAVNKFPEVVDCWLMTGNRDYMLRVATTGLTDFERFLVGTTHQSPRRFVNRNLNPVEKSQIKIGTNTVI